MTLRETAVAEPSAILRSAGFGFWLQELSAWNGSQGTSLNGQVRSAASAEPITITMNYTDTHLTHLDTTQLAFHRWDEASRSWIELGTSLNPVSQTAIVWTNELGAFDLQAPLICPEDVLEVNDRYVTARPLTLGQSIHTLFDVATDEDWFRLEAAEGMTYTIETSQLAAGVNTVIEIYDTNASTLLAQDDDGGIGLASRLVWKAPASRTFYLRVLPVSGSLTGCESYYTLDAQPQPPSSLQVEGPTTGLVEETYTFTATANASAIPPLTYTWEFEEQTLVRQIDGISDTTPYSWTMSGPQTFTVTAENAGGMVSATHEITLHTPVLADFSASPTSGVASLTIDFTNASAGDYTSNLWSFGDGFTSTLENPTHTYTDTGVYTVTLTVSGPGGNDLEVKPAYITVEPHRVYLPLVIRH
jgi:hypothetical protein